MHEQTSENLLTRTREQIIEQSETITDETLIGLFRKAILHTIDCHTRLICQVNQFIPDTNPDLRMFNNSLRF